jgi:proline iminopeptidase
VLRYPQSLTRLILMDTGGDQWWVSQNSSKLLAKRGYSPAAVEAARRFYNGDMTPGEFNTLFLKFGKAYFYHLNYLSLAYEMVFGSAKPKNRPEATVFGYNVLLKDWTVMDRLGEIKMTTLVLAGRYDFLFPPEHQAILADRLPNAQLELVERAGHNPQMEQQAVTVEIIRRFLSGVNS